MTFTAGTKLGAFEILGLLGEGGMGQVHRARDSRLQRDVALKLLPSAFASDADRLARLGDLAAIPMRNPEPWTLDGKTLLFYVTVIPSRTKPFSPQV